MNKPKLRDAREVAREEADAILARPAWYLREPLRRVLADAPWCEEATLTAGLDAYHAEAMAKVPPAAKYPEARPWVEQVLAVDAELKRLANLTEHEMAVHRSLGPYLLFRGFRHARPRLQQSEKCRIAYLPDSEEGQVHIKNVDDPAPAGWQGEPVPKTFYYDKPLVFDGVGSGLHIDDEPEEIFPLPFWAMVPELAGDIPGAVEFIRRYSRFWGGGNMVLHDRQKRSVAIEKCARNQMDIFPPDKNGGSHCSGMACRDETTALGRHRNAKRDEYCRLYGLKEDGADRTFWNICDVAERKLAAGLDALGARPAVAKLFALFTTPWPAGLNKPGIKLHAEQAVPEYTLVTRAGLIDKRLCFHWTRDEGLKYPEEPVVVQF